MSKFFSGVTLSVFAIATGIASGIFTPVHALTWVLSGVTYNNGSTASGSFDFDATTNTFSNVNVTLNTVDLGVLSFSTPADPVLTGSILFQCKSACVNGNLAYDLTFASPLTNNATLPVPIVPNVNTSVYAVFGAPTFFSSVSSGAVTSLATAVPEPGSILGLVAIGAFAVGLTG